jgi:predicted esterase
MEKAMSRVFLLISTCALAACEPAASSPPEQEDEVTTCEVQALATPLTWAESVALESAFIYQGVDNPKALVLLFHGGGGSMEDYFERVEPVLITREALARGMAVASLNSFAHLDPNAGEDLQWEEGEAGDNNDLANAAEMVRKLTTATELNTVPEDTPLVLLGTSNGGSMASRVAQLESLNIAAAIIYISNAVAFHEPDASLPPMVLIPGQQDPGQAMGSNTDLAESIGDPEQALLIANQPEAVSDDLFTRIPDVDCDLSIAIKSALTDGGFLDSTGMVTADPKVDQSWSEMLPEPAETYQRAIRDVLVEAYAGHCPSSDQNDQVFDFVEMHLQ